MPPQCTVRSDVCTIKSETVIHVTGELDMATSPRLSKAIEAAVNAELNTVAVHLGGVTFMETSGLRALLNGYAMCNRDGREFVLRNVPNSVMRLFRIAGVADVFSLDDGS